jgi:hypothetical protein
MKHSPGFPNPDSLSTRREYGFLQARSGSCCSTATTARNFERASSRHFCAEIMDHSVTVIQNGAVMPFTKAIATFASVAAAACGLFAFGWVGLALLGF